MVTKTLLEYPKYKFQFLLHFNFVIFGIYYQFLYYISLLHSNNMSTHTGLPHF